ncbi:MAG: PAS domain S-box protein [Deltaproteobacteria bacterium]|nr:MAG: PAS domain S-box protein [Deltaproteobacteria bacterium]
MDENTPIYSSRVTKVYLGYLKQNYPSMEIDPILKYAGMTRYEVEDPAHWFTQRQVDSFHKILVEKTGNPNISREAGRYLASTEGLGATKQYAMGFMSPAIIYLSLGKLSNLFTRSMTSKSRKMASNKVEIIVKPRKGMNERPFQCENRTGMFESIPKLFSGKYGRIEHPKCLHKGDKFCRYIITWDKTPAILWKLVRNYALLISIFISLSLFFILPAKPWVFATLICALLTSLLSVCSGYIENKEITKTIKSQREAAEYHLNQLNIRYNNALLVQEIGQASSTITKIDVLTRAIMKAMAKRLDFDRGVIMLADKEKTRLFFNAGYGYSENLENLLRQTAFHLDNPESKGLFVKSFREQKPFLIDDILENGNAMSKRSLELAKKMGVRSLICVPIVYEKKSLGILAVDNIESKRALTQSDMSLLIGVASQTAVSIINAMSFQKIQESEEKYRTILESIEDGYFEVDLAGNFTFFNESICKIIGYSKDEMIGMNNRQYMDAENAQKVYRTFNTVYRTSKPTKSLDWKLIRKDQTERFIETLVSLIRDKDGQPVGFRGIARDVTDRIRAEEERKRLVAQLHQAQKMEAIGTLAGGVAHDLNNVLSGLVSYPELLLMDLPEDSPWRKPVLTIQKSGEKASAIVQDLLTLARRGVAISEVVNLNHIVSEYLKSPEHLNIGASYPGVEIEIHLASNLLNILGSPVHLSKTVMNIVANAAEAMPEGGRISITTANRYLDQPIRGYDDIEEGDYVTITVSDQGIGISSEDIDRIFEPFYTKKVMGRSGTGLGMAVVWGTVKDHKGYIDIQSAVGKGTTFSLYFPVTRKTLEVDTHQKTLDHVMGNGETVLIVDDIEEQRVIASEMLNKLGYSVASVASGEEAVDYMKKNSADLLILDMIMDPGIDGLDTYKQILQFHPEQKAIIASGYSETERVKEAQRLGAGVYVKKPYTIEKIGAAAHSELHQSSASKMA